MSADGVDPNEMSERSEYDDAAIEALLAGNGRDVDPGLADFIGDVRVAYASMPPTPNSELAALMGTAPALAGSVVSRKLAQLRSSTLAKVGAATAVLLAATGGLGVAHALPGPVQDAVSHLGIGTSSRHRSNAPVAHDSTTSTVPAIVTSVPAGSTPTTANTAPDHGQVVSGVADDHSLDGCAHGGAVSNVASNSRTHNGSHGGSCDTPTTTTEATTPTTLHHNDGSDNHGGTTPNSRPQDGGSHGSSNTRDTHQNSSGN